VRELSLAGLAGRLVAGGDGLRILASSGIVHPQSPWRLARVGKALLDWGLGPAGGFRAMAARYPDRVAVEDELGTETYADLCRRANALAHALAERGVGEGDAVALMCRNHRGFVETTIAVATLGADVLYLNTAFAGPQLVEVLERESPVLLVHDEEFAGLLEGAGTPTVLAWTDGEPDADAATLERLIAAHEDTEPSPPHRHGRTVILTSGTTGTPKGAPRQEAGFDAAIALLSRMPLRDGWRTHIAAPLFHTWGFAHLMLSMLLGSTMVLRRRFDPADAVEIADGCDSFAVIPVFLQRILELEPRPAYSLARVKVVASSGSALPGDLAVAWMDAYGDHLYNIYGSTEVAYASIATPTDLREAPTSAGRPPWGTVVRIIDADGREAAPGETGRIFVGNSLLFEGYTGGGHKEVVDGLMATGDVGRFGPDGRLYIEGRDDEMIVSGGENVFPKEVEDCLMRHEAVRDAAAVGVPDERFGQRLRAFVVVATPAEGADRVTPEELQEWVRKNLARFKVPREIVVLDELPRNATGKVLKRELVSRKESQ
jgi:acyl-CoA synthetase (AMP-forming)/AMP-acid ligase II